MYLMFQNVFTESQTLDACCAGGHEEKLWSAVWHVSMTIQSESFISEQ